MDTKLVAQVVFFGAAVIHNSVVMLLQCRSLYYKIIINNWQNITTRNFGASVL